MRTKILFVGNCQKNLMAAMTSYFGDKVDVDQVHTVHLSSLGFDRFQHLLDSSDVIFSQPLIGSQFGSFEQNALKTTGRKVIFFPTIVFGGYHPDCIYLGNGSIKSPLGNYHSAITAISHMLKIDPEKSINLYNYEVYEKLGYFSVFDRDLVEIKSNLNKYGISFSRDIGELFGSGLMMHTINHPVKTFLAHYTKALLFKAGVKCREVDAQRYVTDTFPDSEIFPVFPEIASHLGLQGSCIFKPDSKRAMSNGVLMYNLREFVLASRDAYTRSNADVSANKRFTTSYVDLAQEIFTKAISSNPCRRRSEHPYAKLPDFMFWNKAISAVPPEEVDVAQHCSRILRPNDRIASAGSCFAQHMTKALSSSGYNYFIAERPPQSTSREIEENEGFNIFSARYGNIYTARQLVQLFDQAFGSTVINLPPWHRPDGRIVDPRRPNAVPGGFSSQDEMMTDRSSSHLPAVRRVFQEADIFVFTLGLTEAWLHKQTGAILPLAPGVVAGELDLSYEFINFTHKEVKNDITDFVVKLQGVNPSAKVVLTVSPVPLVATFEKRHVLVSTTASKAILRSVADEVEREHEQVYYFPSYEIITGNYNRGAYYEDNLREVRPDGIEHVMRTFLKHCAFPATIVPTASEELQALAEVVCDEKYLNVR